MSADIEKLAVYDGRIVQAAPKYAVSKGALSLTNAPFNAISATSSQHTYNIYVPSENVYVDRAIQWTSGVLMSSKLVLDNAPAGNEVLAVAGRDFALCAFPLNALCSTLTATINDTTTVINSQDVLTQVLRLADFKKNRLQRTCPTMLDKYQNYDDAYGAVNNPIAGYDSQTDFGETPNGAWNGLVFCDFNGTPLGGTNTNPTSPQPAFAGAFYCQLNGVPIAPPQWSVAGVYAVNDLVLSAGSVWRAVAAVTGTPPAAGAWTQVVVDSRNLANDTVSQIYIQWRSTEKLVLSPFVFSDIHEYDTGLFGINNIQLIMNLQSSAGISRVIRQSTRAGRTFAGFGFLGASPFVSPRVNTIFLTPSLDVPLPPKSVVPYMEFPRFISNFSGQTINPGDKLQLQSQTITLPQIPDLFIIYAKPASYGATEGDWVFPVATGLDGVQNPISINFDNFSGLLSSTTAEQLYEMSVKNGVEMDWNTWSGLAHITGDTNGQAGAGPRIPTVGGPLVLRPSQDITLQTGQAPSLVGNFTFQFNLTVKNNTNAVQTPQLYVITVNSGFFESIRGSSRIIKGVLSEADIISAPTAPMATTDGLHRMVGGGLFGSLGNVLSKAKSIYEKTKPIGTAIRGALPEGTAKNIMGMAGYGYAGAGMTGGEGTGAGKRGKKLSARLM